MDKNNNLIYKISITGDLGSGKSTVCKLLSEKLDAKIVSIGTIQRAMAKDMGMTTYEFNRYMEAHPEIDDQFDTMLKSYDGVNDCNLLFDSRLAWNFVPSAFTQSGIVSIQRAIGNTSADFHALFPCQLNKSACNHTKIPSHLKL